MKKDALLIILMVIALVSCNSTEQPSEQGTTGEEQAEQEVKKTSLEPALISHPLKILRWSMERNHCGFDIDLINEIAKTRVGRNSGYGLQRLGTAVQVTRLI